MNDSHALAGKNILLGVTGSIAAYKSAELIRRLKDIGADVRVVMTHAATEFITPLTLQTLSGHPVALDLLDADQESTMGHITLARWADWLLIAPASADTLARFAAGRANDLLSAVILATNAPIAIAPAMNQKMWFNSATATNLEILKQRGVIVLGPASGEQACGEVGEGRLLEPMDIIESFSRYVMPGSLSGKTLVITAGPTYEPIDPVRFIGNRSSGKMGYALAQAAAEAGATVILISGPVNLSTPSGVQRIAVETAKQMLAASLELISQADIFIGCAAVSDFKAAQVAAEKIKKTDENVQTLTLTLNEDVLATISKHPERPQFVVGFAAETQALEIYAKTKLQEKQLDMIAANDVSQGQVFGQQENALQVFWHGGTKHFPTATKIQLARDLMKLIIGHYHAKNSAQTA